MSATHSAAIAQNHILLQHRSNHLNVPQYHILILAWSALVILYGEPGLSRPSRNTANTDGYLPAALY
jgi:hypothetical protein